MANALLVAERRGLIASLASVDRRLNAVAHRLDVRQAD